MLYPNNPPLVEKSVCWFKSSNGVQKSKKIENDIENRSNPDWILIDVRSSFREKNLNDRYIKVNPKNKELNPNVSVAYLNINESKNGAIESAIPNIAIKTPIIILVSSL